MQGDKMFKYITESTKKRQIKLASILHKYMLNITEAVRSFFFFFFFYFLSRTYEEVTWKHTHML